MTLEEINEVEDKDRRLHLLNEYVAHVLQNQRYEDEIAADDEITAFRDETPGMMSRFGKPGAD